MKTYILDSEEIERKGNLSLQLVVIRKKSRLLTGYRPFLDQREKIKKYTQQLKGEAISNEVSILIYF